MVHVPDALIQPVVSDDVVSVLAEIALAPPSYRIARGVSPLPAAKPSQEVKS